MLLARGRQHALLKQSFMYSAWQFVCSKSALWLELWPIEDDSLCDGFLPQAQHLWHVCLLSAIQSGTSKLNDESHSPTDKPTPHNCEIAVEKGESANVDFQNGCACERDKKETCSTRTVDHRKPSARISSQVLLVPGAACMGWAGGKL